MSRVQLDSHEGRRVPSVVFPIREGNTWRHVSSEKLFAGRTVIVFSLPGAFTPICSSAHLPRYNELAPVFHSLGVDEIACISVNDTFVMNAWKADLEAQNITVIPDGNGDFTREMGMLVKKYDLGFGDRSWRYSMLVKNGLVKKQFIEPQDPGDPFKVSDADTMLSYLSPDHNVPESSTIFIKLGCPHCMAAKAQLKKHGHSFEEIVLGIDTSLIALRAITGRDTVPQVFIGGKYIGGNKELLDFLS